MRDGGHGGHLVVGQAREAPASGSPTAQQRLSGDALSSRQAAISHGAIRSQECGAIGPNAIYTYFPDKAAILDAVLDDLLGDVARPAGASAGEPGSSALMTS